MVAVLHEYQWLVVVGAFSAFGFGWGTGTPNVPKLARTSVSAPQAAICAIRLHSRKVAICA